MPGSGAALAREDAGGFDQILMPDGLRVKVYELEIRLHDFDIALKKHLRAVCLGDKFRVFYISLVIVDGKSTSTAAAEEHISLLLKVTVTLRTIEIC